MSKVHLQRNKAEEGQRPIALCATNAHVPMSKGKRVPWNSRSTYQDMTSEIVAMAVFRATEEAQRCAHCCDAALILRNRQRKDKGLSPVSHWNEGH